VEGDDEPVALERPFEPPATEVRALDHERRVGLAAFPPAGIRQRMRDADAQPPAGR